MRIPPYFLDTVGFLCEEHKSKGRNIAGGTAFFVSVKDETLPSREWTYVVTARHCIEDQPHQDIFLRVPTETGGSRFGYKDLHTRKNDWHCHDNADVAAIVLVVSEETEAAIRFKSIPTEVFIDRDYRFTTPRGLMDSEPQPEFRDGPSSSSTVPIQVGDDLFFPGLFIQSAGKEQMLPVARFGNIARMPTDELVFLESRARGRVGVRAYLTECHSWGGYSGSPVFWTCTFNQADKRGDVVRGNVVCTSLLGVVSGHFNLETLTKNRSTREKFVTKVNSGIAIVTPAENILELLMREDVMEDRKQRARIDREPAATADFVDGKTSKQKTLAKKREDRIDIPIPTRGQFEGDLAKATRKRDKK